MVSLRMIRLLVTFCVTIVASNKLFCNAYSDGTTSVVGAVVSPNVANPQEGQIKTENPINTIDTAVVNSQLPTNGKTTNVSSRKPIITLSKRTAVLSGIALALNCGFINGCALSGTIANTKQPSTAVTGALTLSALGAASTNSDQFWTSTRMLLSYVLGSCISSLIHPTPKAFEIAKKETIVSFYLGSILMYFATTFARDGTLPSAKIAFNLAAIVSGMQNSYTSVYTSNLVRSAHFSGISSDIGTFLGQVIRGNLENLYKLKVFLALAAAFWIGGFGAYFTTENLGSGSFLLSSIFYFLAASGLVISDFV